MPAHRIPSAGFWSLSEKFRSQIKRKEGLLMRVMSYNLRFDNPKDGPYAWPKREPAVRWVWEQVDADVVGVQEALPHQLDDLLTWMPGYDYVGRGRNPEGDGEH